MSSNPTATHGVPPQAQHPSDEQAKHPNPDTSDHPASVSQIEQLLRVAIAIGGRKNGIELAQKAIEYQKSHEIDNVFSDFHVDRSGEENTIDPWLTTQLEEIHDKIQQLREEEKDLYDRRLHWYDKQILEELRDKFTRATSMLQDGTEFRAVKISPQATENENDIHVSNLDGTPVEEFGYTPPFKALTIRSPDSGNIYPILPWYGTTACTCPYKHENPVSTLCKHEIAALITYSQNELKSQINSDSIPERFLRLVNPNAYNQFQQNIL